MKLRRVVTHGKGLGTSLRFWSVLWSWLWSTNWLTRLVFSVPSFRVVGPQEKVQLLFHICTSLELFLLFLAGLKSPILHNLAHSLETDSLVGERAKNRASVLTEEALLHSFTSPRPFLPRRLLEIFNSLSPKRRACSQAPEDLRK